ncbi:MAG: hypothetical protein WCF16_13125 [Alphaproteobacteria bacterium]
MARTWWSFVTVIFSAFAAYAGWQQAPSFARWLAQTLLPGVPVSIAEGGAVALATAGSLAACCLFILGFVAPVLEDAWMTAATLVKLRRAGASGALGAVSPEDFRQIFDEPRLAAAAAEYAEALTPVAGAAANPEWAGAPAYRATVTPAACFARERLIEEPVNARFYQYIPAVLWALGAVAFVLGMTSSLAAVELGTAASGGSGLARLVTEAQGGLIAAVIPLGAAPLVGLVFRGMLALRDHQLARLWELVGGLYPLAAGAAGDHEMRRSIGAGAAELTAALKEAIMDLRRELVGSHERLNRTMAQQAKDTGTVIARDVTSAGTKLVAQLADVSRAITQEQNIQAKDILKRTVAVFLAELERNFGNQLRDTHEILKACATLASDVRKEFAQMATAIQKSTGNQAKGFVGDLRKTLETQNEAQLRQSGELVAQLEQAVARLSQETSQQSRTLAELVNRLLGGVEQLNASPLAMSGTEITKLIVAFNDLHTVLAGLRNSLAPVLEKVLAGQERVEGILESETRDKGRVAALATDLTTVTERAREAVEKLQVIMRKPEEPGAGEPGSKVRQSMRESLGRELSEALRALREETESSAARPPKL